MGFATVYPSELNLYRYVSNNPLNYTDPTGTIGLGPLYNTAKKNALATIAGTRKIGDALYKIMLEAYVKADIKSKGKLRLVGLCVEGLSRGIAGVMDVSVQGAPDHQSVNDEEKFESAMCNGIEKMISFSAKVGGS
jgi:hypothetical protein